MPAKNSLKSYSEDSYYHIYNRGVEKRLIFLDNQDYAVFLSYLKDYLLSKDEKGLMEQLADPQTSYKERDQILKKLRLNNFFGEIFLLAYCLMPNHFHFLVKQKSAGSIDKFMNSLGTRYTMYFNRKYKRVGNLCQDVYKAVLVESESQLLGLSRYIHRNPVNKSTSAASQGDALQGYLTQPSSYPEYLGQRKTEWIHPQDVLSYFSRDKLSSSYQSFVESLEQDDSLLSISDITLDL